LVDSPRAPVGRLRYSQYAFVLLEHQHKRVLGMKSQQVWNCRDQVSGIIESNLARFRFSHDKQTLQDVWVRARTSELLKINFVDA
jgi:hypothetical protein